jgi:phosphatidylglycerol---prolipoprotein diacylglyceryl transferase
VPTAVIAFDFDPWLHLGDTAVRWETIGIAAVLFAAIVVAGASATASGLRVDDLLFVVLGVVPGAVLGGRLGYVLLHPAYFAEDVRRVVDPSVGSLELTLGVAGGAITGALIGSLLDGRPGRWLHVGTLPALIALAGGKLAMVLGGSGQGQLTTGEPATAYLGAGPWGSLGPELPSIPAQAIEGVATLAVLVLMLALLARPSIGRTDGRAFLVAFALWSGARLIVSSTWRDPVVIGPFRAEQAIDLVVAIGAVVTAIVVVARSRRSADPSLIDDGPVPAEHASL